MAAPHHGSRNGINKETLRLVEPEIVLINAGVKNQFGHPHQEAMDLASVGGEQVLERRQRHC